MIEHLKELQPNDMITIDHAGVRDLANSEDLTVTEVICHETEDGQVCIVVLDQYSLIAYEVDDIARYFFYESLDDGHGKNKYVRSGNFVRQFKVPTEDGKATYIRTEECPLISEDETINFCQYKADSYYDSMMITVSSEDDWFIYVGFEIEEQQIIV